jgi:serine/threonine protein kinase
MNSEYFYIVNENLRNNFILNQVKSQKVVNTGEGFSGKIAFLDNGEGVHPRYITAKYPKWSSKITSGERARRFLRELEHQALAHSHPNVHWPFKACMLFGVPVAYFRRWEGDLSNYIEEPSFGDLGRICLITQLVAGLLHCHERGLAHQDLKPENVFVRDLRATCRDLPDTDLWLRPLVADFGSVNLAADAGMYRGTRPYMAPEQWDNRQVGEWTSVFVVGVLLHELISRGVHPIGVHGGNWHRGQNPYFNRWQDNNYWRKWVRKGCHIADPLSDTDLAALVADCLKVDSNRRPKLVDVQDRLRYAIEARAPLAADQLTLFLRTAEEQTSTYEWEHLKRELSLLRRAIEAEYPEHSSSA